MSGNLSQGSDGHNLLAATRKYVVRDASDLRRLTEDATRLGNGYSREEDKLESGDFRIDYLAMEVLYKGREVPLSLTQYHILALLTRRPRVVISIDDLIEAIWDTCYVSRNNLHVHIHYIRKALADAGATMDIIRTVRGAGYRFDPPGSKE